MGSLKRGRIFNREALEANLDSAKKTTLSLACPARLKKEVEQLAREEGLSTSEYGNEVLEKIVALSKVGVSIQDLASLDTAYKDLQEQREAFDLVEQMHRDEITSLQEENAFLQGQLKQERAKNKVLQEQAAQARANLAKLQAEHILIPASKPMIEAFDELVAHRIQKEKNKTKTGVFCRMMTQTITSFGFDQPESFALHRANRVLLQKEDKN